MKRKLIISIDVERDIVRYVNNKWTGVDAGMPALLEVLEGSGVTPDLFVEASVAQRSPELLHRAAAQKCLIGTHGLHIDPLVATELKRDALKSHVADGMKALETVTGKRPAIYREANFAVDSRTFSILIDLGFKVDSSVLPNRLVRRYGVIALVDHRGAPDVPYRPGLTNHCTAGTSPLLEIPVTNNPANQGGPIGTGFMNWKGVDDTLRAMRTCHGNPVTFLIHPWECVDLSTIVPGIPDSVARICRENQREVRQLMGRSQEWFEPTSVREVAEDFGVSVE